MNFTRSSYHGGQHPGRQTAFLGTLAVLLSLCFGAARADFETNGFGARTTGMGGGFVGLADDAYAVSYNPAALDALGRREFTASYRTLYVGLDDQSNLGESFIAYAHPLPWGTLGVSMLNFTAGSLYSENTITVSAGREIRGVLRRPFYLGMGVKSLSKKYTANLYTENATDFLGNTFGRDPVFAGGYGKTVYGVDMGAFYRMNREYCLGLALTNINQPDTGMKYINRLPMTVRAGLSYQGDNSTVILDGELRDNDVVFMPGAERWFAKGQLALRAGMQLGSRELANMAFGMSYLLKDMFRIDYSFTLPLRGIQDTYGSHGVSLVVFFDKKDARRTEAAVEEVAPEPAAYAEGVDAYANRNYIKAYDIFRNITSDNASPKYAKLARRYTEQISREAKRIEKEKGPGQYYGRGLAAYMAGSEYEALKSWKESLASGAARSEVAAYVAQLQRKYATDDEAAVEETLAQAQDDLDKGRIEEALAGLHEVLKQSPGDARAMELLDRIRDREEKSVRMPTPEKSARQEKRPAFQTAAAPAQGLPPAVKPVTPAVTIPPAATVTPVAPKPAAASAPLPAKERIQNLYTNAASKYAKATKRDDALMNEVHETIKKTEAELKKGGTKIAMSAPKQSAGGRTISDDGIPNYIIEYEWGSLEEAVENLKKTKEALAAARQSGPSADSEHLLKAERYYSSALQRYSSLVKRNSALLKEAMNDLDEVIKYNPEHRDAKQLLDQIEKEYEKMKRIEQETSSISGSNP